jgi:hypothetical protein
MSKLHHTMASLRFYGDDLIPDEVTKLLGEQPTKSELKGHVRIGVKTGRKITVKTGGWWLDAPVQNDGNLDKQVADLLQNLTPDLEIWGDLTKKFQADVFCGLFMQTGSDGLSMNPLTLHMLGERGLRLEMCIYDPSDD